MPFKKKYFKFIDINSITSPSLFRLLFPCENLNKFYIYPMKMRFNLVFIVCIFCSLNFFCQDGNYWNNQYGAKSTLLCGAAVATYFDNGAIFYNPATLCFKDSGNISLSANLYEAELIKRGNALGEGLDLKGANFNFAPQIVSGNKKLAKKAEIEFILLSRSDVQFNQSLSFNKLYKDTLVFEPQQSLYVGSYNLRKRVLDEWGGISMSFQIGKKMGFGVGSFVSYRLSRYQMSMNASSVGTDTIYQTIAKSDSSLNMFTNTLNLIFKAGWVYHGDKNHFGITLTAPSIHLWGKGNLEYAVFFTDPQSWAFAPSNVYIRRQNLPSFYKYPLSISIGYTRKFKKSQLHFSTEYFAKVLPYFSLPVTSAISKVGSGNVTYGGEYVKGFQDAKRQILNAAIGWEKTLKGNTQLLAGFCTDFNSAMENWEEMSLADRNLNLEGFNLFHFSLGIGFQHNKNNIAVGLSYSMSQQLSNSLADFQNPTSVSKFYGFQQFNCVTEYRSIGIVVGLTY